jgi:hypothetical protein
LDFKSYWFKYSKRALAGCGTQTAALAFGGSPPTIQEQQKNMTVLLGLNPTGLNTARRYLGGCRNSNCSFRFWWWTTPTPSPEQEQQKNMMDQLGHQVLSLNTVRTGLAGCGTQTAALAFGGSATPGYTGATEEYDGTSWTSVNSKYSKIFSRRNRNTNSCFSFWW